MQRAKTRWKIQQWVLVLVLLSATGLAGCDGPPPTPTATPTLPTATPPPQPSPPLAPVTDPAGPEITMEPGKTTAIRASATGATRYEWGLQGPGQISSSTGPAMLYTAPEEEGIAIVTVTAYNDQGASPQTALIINVPAAFVVRLDALAMPLGRISCKEGEEDFIKLEGCPDNCHTGSDCIQFTYSTGRGCGGVYWWPFCIAVSQTLKPIPEWPFYILVISHPLNIIPGEEYSIDVLKAGNLSEVDRLTFWCRGDQGGELVEFGIGGPNVEPRPGRSTGAITLKPTWEQHKIDLKGLDLTKAIVLFRWRATDIHHPRGAIFYLDDIQFEGLR